MKNKHKKTHKALCLFSLLLIISLTFFGAGARVYNVNGSEIEQTNQRENASKGYKTAPIPVFLGGDKGKLPKSLATFTKSREGIYYKSPSMTTFLKDDKQSLIVAAVKGSSDKAFGTGEIVIKRSNDNGVTWDSERTVFRLPVRKSPKSASDFSAAFNSECIIQSYKGEIILMTIMYPESKGAEDVSWVENADVYKEIDGVLYPVLYNTPSAVGKTISAAVPKEEYTVRENGFVYTPNGEKTPYYLPQIHSAETYFATMGDMYYCVGEPDFAFSPPPLFPEYKPGTEADIYVGNVYLSVDMPEFSLNLPVPVTKRRAGDLAETSAAPLRAPVTANVFVLKSTDGGESFSQPKNITYQIKGKADKGVLGFASNCAAVLQNQVYLDMNGRLLVFFKNPDGIFAAYSDDKGESFKRRQRLTLASASFSACLEDEDGILLQLVSKKKSGAIISLESSDSGVKWNDRQGTGLYTGGSISALRLPVDNGKDSPFKYAPSMEQGREYIIVAHCTDKGVLTLGALNPGEKIDWVSQREFKDTKLFNSSDKYKDYVGKSCLTVMQNGNLGIVYESAPGSLILFEQLSLDWLCSGEAPKLKSQIPPILVLLMLAAAVLAALTILYALLRMLLKKSAR